MQSSGSVRKTDARELLRKRLGEIASGRFAGPRMNEITIGELLEGVIRDYRINERKSRMDLENRTRKHLVPFFGDTRAANFSTALLQKYIDSRKSARAANATINRELSALKRAFHLAYRHDPPLVRRVPHIAALEENNVRTGFLDADRYARLLEELPDHLKVMFVVAYHTGARRGELAGLLWSQIRFGDRLIVLRPGETKSDEGRILPIYGEMERWLRWQADRCGAHHSLVFPNSTNGSEIVDLRKAWTAACDRAGVPGLLFHDLRRSAVRNMRKAGIAEAEAMKISGHKTRSVFERYNIVSEEDVLEAARKVELYLKKKGAGR